MSTILKDGKVIYLPECFGKLHSFTDPVCIDCPVNTDCECATTSFNQSLVEVVVISEIVELDTSSPAAERLMASLVSEQVCYNCNGWIKEYGSTGSVADPAKAVHNARKGFRHGKCPVEPALAVPST